MTQLFNQSKFLKKIIHYSCVPVATVIWLHLEPTNQEPSTLPWLALLQTICWNGLKCSCVTGPSSHRWQQIAGRNLRICCIGWAKKKKKGKSIFKSARGKWFKLVRRWEQELKKKTTCGSWDQKKASKKNRFKSGSSGLRQHTVPAPFCPVNVSSHLKI